MGRMTLDQFTASLAAAKPPAGLTLALAALWWDAKGDWNAAHAQVQRDEGNPECDWVHAYLHRKEGDAANAGYWYRSAGRKAAAGPLEREWTAIAAALTQPKDARRQA
mgnify:FL=1